MTLVHKGNIMKLPKVLSAMGYELAEKNGDQVFTWDEYDRIKERKEEEPTRPNPVEPKKIIIKDAIADIFRSRS